MRKRFVGLIAAVAALALVASACDGDEPKVKDGDQKQAFTTLTEGVLAVGSCLDYSPFESVEQGDEVGFDVDLTEEIASRLGLTVEWVRADFDTIFTAVAGGQFDMVAAAVTATGADGKERDQTVDFSDFYFNSRQSLAVNTTETPDIDSTDDLGDGDTVGVQRGTTGQTWAEDNLEPQGVEIKTYKSSTDALRDLEAGTTTGVVTDEPFAADVIKDLASVELVQGIDTNEKYAFAFAEDNPELIEAVNGALAEIIADGTWETIYRKYFPIQEVPPEYAAAA